jgi:hypothetical protein
MLDRFYARLLRLFLRSIVLQITAAKPPEKNSFYFLSCINTLFSYFSLVFIAVDAGQIICCALKQNAYICSTA